MKRADEILKDCSNLYKDRQKIYGDNYKIHGKVMLALFPDGIDLETVNDHNRFGILTQIVCKLLRYTENFSMKGHEDSLVDICTYTAILVELDQIINEEEN